MASRDFRVQDWRHGRYLERRLAAWQFRQREVLRQLERDFRASALPDVAEAHAAVDGAFDLVSELRHYAMTIEAQAAELNERLHHWESAKLE